MLNCTICWNSHDNYGLVSMSALFLMSELFIIADFVVLCLEDNWGLSIFVATKCNGWNDQFQVLLNSWISVNFPIKCYKSQDLDFNFISNKSKLYLPFTEYSIKIVFKPINSIQLEIKYCNISSTSLLIIIPSHALMW